MKLIVCVQGPDTAVYVITVNDVGVAPPVIMDVIVNGKELPMQVDTGAGVAVLSHTVFMSKFKGLPIYRTSTILFSVSGQIKVFGKIYLNVHSKSGIHKLDILVCETQDSVKALLGRPWLDVLYPSWRNVFKDVSSCSSVLDKVHSVSNVNEYVHKLQSTFPTVFDPSNDQPIKHFKARLHLKDNAVPIFAKAYSLPYAIVDVVSDILLQLQQKRKIFQVQFSENASPCVPV